MSEQPLTIHHLRRAIDAADEIILRAIAARFKAVEHLKKIKQDAKMAVENKYREEEIKNLWKKQAQDLNISQELALMILDFLLSESKRIQQS